MWTIVRHTAFRDTYLYKESGDDADTWLFETEKEALMALSLCFENGEEMEDERYGRCRYYVEPVSQEALDSYFYRLSMQKAMSM